MVNKHILALSGSYLYAPQALVRAPFALILFTVSIVTWLFTSKRAMPSA